MQLLVQNKAEKITEIKTIEFVPCITKSNYNFLFSMYGGMAHVQQQFVQNIGQVRNVTKNTLLQNFS